MKWNSGKIGTAVLIAIAVLAIIFGAGQFQQAKAARTAVTGMQQRAMFNLISHVENIESCLAKVRAASTTGQQTTFLTSTWSHAQAAADNLGQFSMAKMDLTSVRAFVSRIGDYSLVLSQRLARGDVVTQAEWDELKRLEDSTKDLAAVLLDMGRKSLASASGVGKVGASTFFPRQRATDDWLEQGFSEIDSLTQSIPSPVYDGPFSDRNQTALGLARPGDPVSLDTAKTTAAEFLMPGDVFDSVRVEESEGALPSFLVTGKRGDGTEVTTAVAKQGGMVVWSADSRMVGPSSVKDLGAAREAAKAFLASKGFTGLAETGWRRPGVNAGRVVFAYAPETTMGGDPAGHTVRLYPDLVKVEVAIDDGRIIAFDQRGYLTTHDSPARTLRPPLVSAREARMTLKRGLEVNDDGRLCVIPMLPTREVLAWEFTCRTGNDMYLVYINAMTGKEEAIYQVIADDEGSLTT